MTVEKKLELEVVDVLDGPDAGARREVPVDREMPLWLYHKATDAYHRYVRVEGGIAYAGESLTVQEMADRLFGEGAEPILHRERRDSPRPRTVRYLRDPADGTYGPEEAA